MALNNDLAPTFADEVGVHPPDFVDGRSLEPLLIDDPPPEGDWRSAFLLEAVAERRSIADQPLSGDPMPEGGRRAPGEGWGRSGSRP